MNLCKSAILTKTETRKKLGKNLRNQNLLITRTKFVIKIKTSNGFGFNPSHLLQNKTIALQLHNNS